jgi:hypothetical protein
MFLGEIDDKVIKSVGRQQDESDSVGLEFVKMDTATWEIQHLGELDDEVIKSVSRQQDDSNSFGLEFVKKDTATREIQHLDTGQMRDEFSTLGKVLYKTPDRLGEQYRFRVEEGFMMGISIKLLVEQLMAAMEMKYDEVITMRNMDKMKLLHVDTTENNVFKTRIEMVEQHMAAMRMKYDDGHYHEEHGGDRFSRGQGL